MKIHPKRLILALALSAGALGAATVYQESDGLVVMEAENTASPFGSWRQETDLPGYTGRGYLHFTGNEHILGDADSPLAYHFKINRTGVYVLDLHCAKIEVDGRTDWANDCYVRVVGDYSAGPGPHDLPRTNASLHMLKSDMKYFGGRVDEWEWAVGDWANTGGRLDPGGRNNKRKAIYQFKAGETYTLVLSGRSKDFRVDRVVFRLEAADLARAHSADTPESSTAPGNPPMADDCDVVVAANAFSAESHPSNEAVVAADGAEVSGITDGSWLMFAGFDFGVGHPSSIDLQVSSAHPGGGAIEVRTTAVDGPLIATVPVYRTWTWSDFEAASANLATVSGRHDLYLVFKGGEGELFRLRSFLIRSGEREDDKPALPPIRPPAGRLAYIADGNSPDPDDIGGTAAALAMLRAAGLANRLVHLSHSCDLVKASNISAEMELKRQTMMQVACDGTISRWGGFEGITAWNCRTQQEEAVAELTAAINSSTAADPLWVVEAGEPDIIGYALERAEPAKRKFVKLLTHHVVNDGSGDFFKYPQILAFGVEEVRIPDQNGSRLDNGLQRPEWAFYWARDHADERIRWIWEQGKLAEEDGVVSFQDGKIDISDAGMIFYWITGANEHDGYRVPSVHDVRLLLEAGLTGTRAESTPAPTVLSRAEIEAGLKSRDCALQIMPEWIRDPYITRGPGDYYYLLGTTFNEGDPRYQPHGDNIGMGAAFAVGDTVRAWRSKDLIDWEYLGVIFDLQTDGPNQSRGDRIWAPEAHWIPAMNRWALIHCPRRVSTLALSAGPELCGPWTFPMGAGFVGRHDPSMFRDGNAWWVLSGNTVVEPLAADFSGFNAEPVRIDPAGSRTNSQGQTFSVIGHEGTTMIKVGSKYVHFGTAWSTDLKRKGSYNLYYCTSDAITGPYGPRRFAGRFMGHGTPFQTRDGQWWCTAFCNASVPPLSREGIASRDLRDNAYTINARGTTIVPIEVTVLPDGDVAIRALDPAYATPGPDEVQKS